MDSKQSKKLMIVNILRILERHSDKEHRLSRQDIIRYLKKDYDMDADRKAVKRNLANLVASGYDLECTEPAADKKPCAKNNQHNTLSALSRDTS
ncbi:MAG: hypothetical protein RR085_09550 [Clostridia bacterium]